MPSATAKIFDSFQRTLGIGLLLLSAFGCSRELSDCNGYAVDQDKLLGIRETLFTGGPKASLIVPNPLDAGLSNLSSGLLESSALDFALPDLLSPRLLQTDFLKIRVKTTEEQPTENTSGVYDFPIQNVRYSETMAYHSMSAMVRYVETLGFSLVKTRPLYVMVRTESPDSGGPEVNAIYTHNYFNPSLPRTLQLYGDTTYAPGMDRDIYWHEFGHFLNESLSREAGIDLAGDAGAVFTEGAALHECMADYLAESVGNKGYIGRWLAKNFSNIPSGQPLRNAERKADDLNSFNDVSTMTNDGKNLDRYRMAEWCSRVMWNLRQNFVKEDSNTGALFADRLIFSAVSMLKRDTSIAQFRAALLKADSGLHCGLHQRSIQKSFEMFGFPSDAARLNEPLKLQATPKVQAATGSSSASLTFAFTIRNPNGTTARNVRIFLESPDGKITPVVYMQGFADLPPGGSIQVGTTSGFDLSLSVLGTPNASGAAKYRLRIKVENGADTVLEGQTSL